MSNCTTRVRNRWNSKSIPCCSRSWWCHTGSTGTILECESHSAVDMWNEPHHKDWRTDHVDVLFTFTMITDNTCDDTERRTSSTLHQQKWPHFILQLSRMSVWLEMFRCADAALILPVRPLSRIMGGGREVSAVTLISSSINGPCWKWSTPTAAPFCSNCFHFQDVDECCSRHRQTGSTQNATKSFINSAFWCSDEWLTRFYSPRRKSNKEF